ncbi:MAG: DUF4419 domain-containing protein [Planctomycetes bacterium]|nr:DUF4419 domain-containing protein [Planctomycetota bacterium]
MANHVNAHAERLRDRFVRHDGQLTIEFQRDDFIKGSPENPWPEVFAEFSDAIKDHIGEAHGVIVADFSTTGPVERAASEVVLLDAMQAYFAYEMQTECGIPWIKLEGATEDWQALARRVRQWRRFDLTWWVRRLEPILDQFVAASQGNVESEFWDSIYKWHGAEGSGESPYVTGWMLKLFPYLNRTGWDFGRKQGATSFRRNPWLNRPPAQGREPGVRHFPHLPARAPFLWNYLDEQFEMEFVGGLIGVRQDAESLALRPEIGWAVLDKKKIAAIQAEEEAARKAWLEERKAWVTGTDS